METIYKYVHRVILKNNDEELFLNYPCAFEENTDEILVRTQIVNTNLRRGWIGDLTYDTKPGLDPQDGEINSFGAQGTFRDVLLASVKIWMCDDEGVITWEYRFLKK